MLLFSISVGATTNVVYGDVDDNGTIDTKDIRLYLKSILSSEVNTNIPDLNEDGINDTLDVRKLLKEIIATDVSNDKLLAFQTPKNSSLMHEEIEANRVAQVINTYEEFETVCATIRSCFYTPYENENGSFDGWAETVTPDYFKDKSLFIITHGTAAMDFKLNYAVSQNTVDITVEQDGMNAFGQVKCWQLIIELNKEDLIDRQLNITFE